MAQEQPSSLPHWRTRQTVVGAERALKEAALECDRLVDELGRRQDRGIAELVVAFLIGAALGFVLGASV